MSVSYTHLDVYKRQPIYNVESYLKECVDSILFQTYKNIEVMLVDDESPEDVYKRQVQNMTRLVKRSTRESVRSLFRLLNGVEPVK